MILQCLELKSSVIRMLKQIEELILVFNIKDEVVVQLVIHITAPHILNLLIIGESELDEYINKAKVIITHAGAGSIFKSIMAGKKIIVMARKRYGEMIDDHQLELAKKLSEDVYFDGSRIQLLRLELLESFVPENMISLTIFI